MESQHVAFRSFVFSPVCVCNDMIELLICLYVSVWVPFVSSWIHSFCTSFMRWTILCTCERMQRDKRTPLGVFVQEKPKSLNMSFDTWTHACSLARGAANAMRFDVYSCWACELQNAFTERHADCDRLSTWSRCKNCRAWIDSTRSHIQCVCMPPIHNRLNENVFPP